MGKLSADSLFGRGVGLMRGSAKNKKSSFSTKWTSSKATIGVLSFEVAGLMCKAVHLWHSLGDDQMFRLRDEVLQMEGVRKIVSDDDDFLLTLSLAEIMDSLRFLACSVARLGKKCTDPVLQRFDHVFADLISNDAADLFGFQYAGKKMERKVKKMERLVAASSNLYHELEVLAELEQTLRRIKLQARSDPNRRLADFKQKVVWQRQEVKCLRETSLWNRTYYYTVRLLARSLFTILARIKHLFGSHHSSIATFVDVLDDDDLKGSGAADRLSRCHSVAGLINSSVHPSDSRSRGLRRFSSGPLFAAAERTDGGEHLSQNISLLPPWKYRNSWKKNKWPVSSRSFGGCMVGGDDSPALPSCIPVGDAVRMLSTVPRTTPKGIEDDDKEVHFQGDVFNYKNLYLSLFTSQHKQLKAPPSTLGAAALALHYANVIILIEKLTASPHLIGPDARDDLYSMLPTSIRATLRARLKSYAKNLNSSFYDPVLAAEWTEALTRILDWLAPLAHNMIRWQSDRNFEQQHLVSSTNILLVQTLYFANQEKSEAAITELLVGLNYLWRFGRELNAKTILECVDSRNYDNCLNSKG